MADAADITEEESIGLSHSAAVMHVGTAARPTPIPFEDIFWLNVILQPITAPLRQEHRSQST